jgi:hypothetical protein
MAWPLHDKNNDGVCFALGAFGHDSNMGVIRSDYVPRNRVIVLNRRFFHFTDFLERSSVLSRKAQGRRQRLSMHAVELKD